MPELSGRKLHLIKKSLAIAVASMERRPVPTGLGHDRDEGVAR